MNDWTPGSVLTLILLLWMFGFFDYVGAWLAEVLKK